MALDNIFSNLKEQTGGVTGKLKKSVTEIASTTGIMDANKQKMKPLVAEKAKMYEFIGMEVFDLYMAGKMNLNEIEPFCKKIEMLNIEIAKLEPPVAQLPSVCECGVSLPEGAKFCFSCGKSVTVKEPSICECGAQLDGGAKFCASCGKTVDTIAQQQEVNKIECVCGAVAEPDVQMCMECGRRIVLNS